MELIVGGVFLLLMVLAVGMYYSDREGWNATFKRVTFATRAAVESRSFQRLERVQTGDKDRWEAEFHGHGSELVVLPEKNHQIVRHDYYKAFGGAELWPRWTCKCGASDKIVTMGGNPSWFNKKAAVRGGRTHVRVATKHDARLEANPSSKDFMF